jgi:hypothetical protein
MVAACAASQTADVRVASAVGSLVRTTEAIGDPRSRLEALVRVIAAMRRLALPVGWAVARARALVEKATCPAPLRAHLRDEVRDFDAPADALGLAIDALFSRGWTAAATRAVTAALAMRRRSLADNVVHAAERHAAARAAVPALRALVATGYVAAHGGGRAWPRLVADVRERGSEAAFRPSLPLAIAVVDAACAGGDLARVTDVAAMLPHLRAADRPIAVAHVARAVLRADGVPAALGVVRGIRAASVRAGARLLLVRDAVAFGDLDGARSLARDLSNEVLAGAARIAIARALDLRDEPVAALRLLAAPMHPALAYERFLLRTELRLAREQRAPRGLCRLLAGRRLPEPTPAWTHPAPALSTHERHRVVVAVEHLGTGYRYSAADDLACAARHLRELAPARHLRRAFLVLAARACDPVEDVLVTVGDRTGRTALDLFTSERVGLAADALPGDAALYGVAPLRLGLAGDLEAAPAADPRSVERALFDEGLALSPHADRRRVALVNASRYCLRTALAAPGELPEPVIASRLRTLVHLGGAASAASIAKPVETLPHDRTSVRAVVELAAIDARAAADLAVRLLVGREPSAVRVEHALCVIEQAGGLPAGYASTLVRVRDMATRTFDHAAGLAWLAELARACRERTGDLPDRELLDYLAAHPIPASPAVLFAQLDEARAAQRRGLHTELAARAAASPALLAKLLVAQPPRLDPTLRPWRPARWGALLRVATRGDVELDDGLVHRAARYLRQLPRWDALRAGDLVALGAQPETDFTSGGERYRVRLLDKRADLLTYLRFADTPARSCFRSDSYYGGSMQSHRLAAWRDPLTFCLHVERRMAAGYRVRGFFFGGFALVDGAVAIVMNSLHVRPNTADVRARVFAALESMIATPLGITRIGLANVHGGRGPLPSDFTERATTLTRLRALRAKGSPVTRGYDDIAHRVNEPALTHLWWRARAATYRGSPPTSPPTRRAGC